VVSGALLPWLALLGGGYCLYLGYRIARAAPPTAEGEGAATRLTFASGLLIQGLNPKAWLAVLPIAFEPRLPPYGLIRRRHRVQSSAMQTFMAAVRSEHGRLRHDDA